MTARVDVVEITDPSCSWAWGTEPKLRRLQWQYGDNLNWRRVLGGLVPDQSARRPDWDGARGGPRMSEYWSKVTVFTDMPYPVHLQWAPRSSEEACLAVKAAERQGDRVAEALLRRCREETFVFGRPADNVARVLLAAEGIDGLDVNRLHADMYDPAVVQAYRDDWEETRTPNEYVLNLHEETPGAGGAKEQEGRMRFVFPTILFRGPEGERTVPGWKPWESYADALAAVAPGSTDTPRPLPTATEAFARWPLMASSELEFLCGGVVVPPPGTVAHDWGAGQVWMTEQEAASRLTPAT